MTTETSKAAAPQGLPAALGLSLDLQSLPQGLCIYSINDSGEIRAEFMSELCAALMGLEKIPPMPCALEQLPFDEKQRAEYERQLRQFFAVGVVGYRLTQCLQRADGRKVWRQVELKPLRHEGRLYLLEWSQDDSQAQELRRKFHEFNARLALSVEQTSQKLWELDLQSSIFSIYDPTADDKGALYCHMHFPDELISQGWIHPDSLFSFKLFARKIMGGERRGGSAFMMRSLAGSGYTWYALSFRMLFNEDEMPIKAVGVLSSFDPSAAAPRFALYSRLWEYLLPTLYSYMCFNVTHDRIEQLWQSGRNLTNAVATMDYNEFLLRCVKTLFTTEEGNRLLKIYSKDELLKYYDQGTRWLFNQFDVEERGGYVRRIAAYSLLTREELSDDLYVFSYMHYIDRKVRRFGESYKDAQHIANTGLYDAVTARMLCFSNLNSSNHSSAFAIIHFCNFRGEHNHTTYYFIATAFALFFEADAVAGELKGNSLSLFFPDSASLMKIRQMIESSFIFVRRILGDSRLYEIRFVAVLCYGRLQTRFYDDFVAEGMLTCRNLENRPSDYIELLPSKSEQSEYESAESLIYYSTDLSAMRYASLKENLTEEEVQLVFKCLDIMLTASNKISALHWILGTLGRYYRADRIYVLQLIEGSMCVDELGEWDGSGKSSFRGLLTGMNLERTPLLKRAFMQQRPVCLSRRDRAMAMQYQADLSATWSFTAYPLTSPKGDLKAMLCIDNPHEHEDSLSLIASIKVYLTNLLQGLLKERYSYDNTFLQGGRIYNLQDYNELLPQLNSDVYSSMGVFALCIPRVLQLANELSMDHVSRLLAFLKELLRRTFGNSFIFNLLEHEFVIFVPNTIKEIFFERVKRVQDIVSHNYANQVSFGSTWSRGAFDSENLVREATTFMLATRPPVPALSQLQYGQLLQQTEPEMRQAAMLRKFKVFFQPKIDLGTGEVIGAEALVRGVAEDGSIELPGRFISHMEQSGSLRELDLFVFSRVLWQMKNWQDSGLQVVPVSVNFSRFTMFDSATSGAVLALLSHYSDEAASQIEIELTETACSVESATLNRAMIPYRSLGLSFALDDFGTGYANLALLSHVHFDSIKIDRSLISDLSVNKLTQSLLCSLVSISRASNMKLIAEGVEYEEQALLLLEAGCRYAQGFYYDKAIAPEKFAVKYLKAS